MSARDQRLRAASELWTLGDYDRIAPHLAPVAEAAVDAIGIRSGERVLDVAAGTGNVALAAAQRGAEVVALELTDALRERGARRTAEAGAVVEWVAGNAEELPFGAAGFDAVVSVLGVMFAPDPQRAADEMLRVTRPGGRIATAAWTRDGTSGVFSAVMREHMPVPPPGMSDPHDWGEPDRLAAWLADGVDDLHCEQRTITWRGSSADDIVATLEQHAAAFVAARTRLGAEGWPAARADLVAVATERGRVVDDGFALDWTYLLATARRR